MTKKLFSLSTYFRNNQTYEYRNKDSINLTQERKNNAKLEGEKLIYEKEIPPGGEIMFKYNRETNINV